MGEWYLSVLVLAPELCKLSSTATSLNHRQSIFITFILLLSRIVTLLILWLLFAQTCLWHVILDQWLIVTDNFIVVRLMRIGRWYLHFACRAIQAIRAFVPIRAHARWNPIYRTLGIDLIVWIIIYFGHSFLELGIIIVSCESFSSDGLPLVLIVTEAHWLSWIVGIVDLEIFLPFFDASLLGARLLGNRV